MAAEQNRSDCGASENMDLLDLLIVVFKYKRMILSIVGVSVLIGAAFLYIPWNRGFAKSPATVEGPDRNVLFYSECLIEPLPGMEAEINWLFPRRNFVLSMLKENDLLLPVQNAISSQKLQGQANDKQPTADEVYRWVRDNLYVTPNSGVITIGFTAPEEYLPINIINGFLNSLSNFAREYDLEMIKKKKDTLNKQLAVSSDSILKEKIAEKLIMVEEDEASTKQKYYRFKLLDPASNVEKVRIGKDRKIETLTKWVNVPNGQKTKTAPARKIQIFLIVLVSFVIALSIAFFREYLTNMAIRDPEKVAALKNSLNIFR